MQEPKHDNSVAALRRKWKYTALLSYFLIALAITAVVSAVHYKCFYLSLYWCLPVVIILFFFITLVNRRWRISEPDVCRYLDSTLPSLEESTHLILRPHSSLTTIEKLQVAKVEHRLLSVVLVHPFKTFFVRSVITLLICLAISAGLLTLPFNRDSLFPKNVTARLSPGKLLHEMVLPGIKNATIIITPPAYTGMEATRQSMFNLVAEENAVVSWQIQTNIAAKEIKLLFNNGQILHLAGDARQLTWHAQTIIKAAGFYQVEIDANTSAFYKIEFLKDNVPEITIQSPEANTLINYGMPGKVTLDAFIKDDYGISSAAITATLSKGAGEAVKFTERSLLNINFPVTHKDNHLKKIIDCSALGMVPGDELYFFVSATDNHNQQARSDIYIVTLQDTAGLMSIEGMEMSLDVKTEFFRSERQIIIETEQLLRDKPTITIEKFRQKSNELGIDQQLLRLRYGKFSGEETQVENGIEDEHDEQTIGKDLRVATTEKYGHEHDNAEDAGLFDPSTRKQLRTMLTEMWNAELKLRTSNPVQALPFEYKALRLLKDLQQRSRVYVQKTGTRTTPLQPGKRLTGDLSEISQPVTRKIMANTDSSATIARTALSVLEELKTIETHDISSNRILQMAFRQLGTKAASQPAAYLTSLAALQKILSQRYSSIDIDNAQKGLEKMIADPERLPYANSNAAKTLSGQYFKNLSKSSKQ